MHHVIITRVTQREWTINRKDLRPVELRIEKIAGYIKVIVARFQCYNVGISSGK